MRSRCIQVLMFWLKAVINARPLRSCVSEFGLDPVHASGEKEPRRGARRPLPPVLREVGPCAARLACAPPLKGTAGQVPNRVEQSCDPLRYERACGQVKEACRRPARLCARAPGAAARCVYGIALSGRQGTIKRI